MATAAQRPKLVAIVGPTASGKSDLAMRIAREFGGEIICADSRTVYKEMDIGTAKPSIADQKRIPHWGLDLVKPGERFSVVAFKKYAEAAILNIQARGKLPVLVGGTGLYIDSVLFDFGFKADANLLKRQKLEKLSVAQLQKIINKKSYKMPENNQNKRHLIRVIETRGQKASKVELLPKNVVLAGLLPNDEKIKANINARIEKNFPGIVLENAKLLKKYGEDRLLATAGIAYKTAVQFIGEEIDQDLAIELIKNAEWQYARRQKTWFKRNKFIHWFSSKDRAYKYIRGRLNT